MAIVIGPLHSVAASGQIGKCMVFQDHPQRQIVRQYIPTVTQNSPNQITALLGVGTAGKIAATMRMRNWVYRTGNTNIINELEGVATGGSVWPSVFTEYLLGKGFKTFTETRAEYFALPFEKRRPWGQQGESRAGLRLYNGPGGTSATIGVQYYSAQKAIAAAGVGPPFNPETPHQLV